MSQKVKKDVEGTRRPSQTKVSSKHQVTIPAAAFHSAGLRPGDTLRVQAEGAGRLVLTRTEELLDRYSGALDSGGGLRAQVEGLRGEWP
jgi:AbrB family looped-hinge helix DNA binding protein